MNIEGFFKAIDNHWVQPAPGKIRLGVIGSAALLLQTDYDRGTKDSDILEALDLTSGIKRGLLELAGQGSDIHKRHRLYLDFVPSGLPFLPQAPVFHFLHALNATLRHFQVEALDVVDVIVSKLKRFNANDVGDIQAMVKRDLVGHEALISRFKSAVDAFSIDARAEELPLQVRNLHTVERDMLGVAESKIELPDWLDR